LAGLLVSGCNTDPGSSDTGPIKIGLIQPLTGPYQALGTEAQKGVEIAVAEINKAGGVNNRQLELVVRDDKTTPDQSVLAFNDVKGQVTAVIGSIFSNCALAVIPQADRGKVPYLSLSPADEQVDPVKKYVFMVPAKSSTYAERSLQLFKGTGKTKIAVAHDTKSSYALAGHKATIAKAKDYGIEIVEDLEFDSTTKDFSPLFAKSKNKGAQGLLVWVTGPPAVTITKQYAAAKPGVELYFTGAEASKLYAGPAGAEAEGVTMAASIALAGKSLPDGTTLKTAVLGLVDAYKAKYNSDPPQFAVDGYSSVKLLAEAIKQAKSTDAEDIQKALEKLKLVVPNGEYVYTADDHSGLTTGDTTVVAIRNGQFEPVSWAKEQFPKDITP